jgi:hypothetical protein
MLPTRVVSYCTEHGRNSRDGGRGVATARIKNLTLGVANVLQPPGFNEIYYV